jgi:YspA, cpYpsA-related SLOG family
VKTIIAGSRTIEDYLLVEQAIRESGFEITEVVSGTARGVDRLGEQWAFQRGIPVQRFFPDWDQFGKRAGFLRNEQMAKYAEALIAVSKNGSSGTNDMIRRAELNNLKIHILYLN